MALKGEVEGCLSAKQVTDIYYALRRYASQKVRDRIMRLLLDWFYILPLQPEYLSKALRYSKDYEDEVLIVTAEENRISYIVTADKSGFVSYPSAITPEEAIIVLKKTS